MNALALKKFVEENQKLALECANLLSQCSNWQKECSLYDHDREALMDFGNEADQRAKEAEIRVRELEEELRRLVDELRFYKQEYELRAVIYFCFCRTLGLLFSDPVKGLIFRLIILMFGLRKPSIPNIC